MPGFDQMQHQGAVLWQRGGRQRDGHGMDAPGQGRPMLVSLVAVLAVLAVLSGCGRKSALEVPGSTTGALPPPSARMSGTDLDDGVTAPPLGSRIARQARFRSSDIRGANADAPGPGETVPGARSMDAAGSSARTAFPAAPDAAVPATGPEPAASAPGRRFLLDPLL